MSSLTTSPPSLATANLWLCFTETDQMTAGPLTDLIRTVLPNRSVQMQPMPELAVDESNLVLAVTLHPVLSLALRLNKGADSGAALAEWTQWADGLLKTQRRNRRRIIFVDPQAFTANSSAQDRSLIAARLSENAFISFASPLKTSDLIPDPKPVDMLCAAALLESNPQAKALMEELLAATIGAKSKVVDIAIIEQARSSLPSTQKEAETLVNLQTERELLRDNLQYSVDEFERVTNNVYGLQAQLADERQKASRMQVEALSMRRERDAARREAEKHKKNIHKILTTKSWRITAPLRTFRGWF